MSVSQDDLKKMVAEAAGDLVLNGMLVGLGTGSTAKFLVDYLGQKFVAGELEFRATPTSKATEAQALSYGIPIVDLAEIQDGEIDLVIDGADQIDLKTGVCIKGGGGAHYWEKMVAKKSKKMAVVVDESKIVESFAGYKIPLEIEVAKKEEVAEKLGVVYREKLSDFGNLIGDVMYDGAVDLLEFEKQLMAVDGVIETGIFSDLVKVIFVSYAELGDVKVYEINN